MHGTSHDAHHHAHADEAPPGAPATQTRGGHAPLPLVVPTGPLDCDGCASCVEERLREHPHVVGVHVDTRHEVAHVTVHEGMVTADELTETIAAACGDRNVVPLPKPQLSSHAHAHIARPQNANDSVGHADHMASATAPVDSHAA